MRNRNYRHQEPSRAGGVIAAIFFGCSLLFLVGSWANWVSESDEFRYQVMDCMLDGSKDEYIRCSVEVSERHESETVYANR